MPCSDSIAQDREWNAAEMQRLRDAANQAARAACEALRKLEELGHVPELSTETKSWWSRHRIWDRNQGR